MKKIALISPCVPKLTGAGAQQRAMNHLRALSTIANVDLLVIYDQQKQRKLPSETEKLCAKYKILYSEIRKHLESRMIIGAAFFNELISLVARRTPSGRYIKDAAIFLNETDYDLIFCFRISTAILVHHLKHLGLISFKRVVVDFDDIESITIKRAIKQRHAEFGVEFSMIRRLHAIRAKSSEKFLSKVCDGIIVCSELDKICLLKYANKSRAFVIPNCIDVPTYIEDATPENNLSMLFVGSMSHLPNIDGIDWFIKKVYPLILNNTKVYSELVIVGYNPPKHLKKYEDKYPGIKVMGGVESVKEFYKKCNVVIAPIRFGGGTRVKILEGMSYSRPVVSTTLGAEGINIKSNENILIADTIESFSQMCLKLALDRKTRLRIGQNGFGLVSEQYSINEFISKETALIHELQHINK